MFKYLRSRSHAAFSLAEVAITLGAIAVLIGITLPMAMSGAGEMQTDANRARAKGMMAQLSAALSDYLMTGQNIESATDDLIFDNVEFSKKLTSGSITLDPAPRNLGGTAGGASQTFNLSSGGTRAYQMKSGGVLVVTDQAFNNASFTACVGMVDATSGRSLKRRAMHALFDPDGKVSGEANSVHVFIYEDASARTLETLGGANTCVHGNATQPAIANADPNYLD